MRRPRGSRDLVLGVAEADGRRADHLAVADRHSLWLHDGCQFDLEAPVTIGNHVSVGHEVSFHTTRRQEGVETAAPITIGDGVWLGARSTILAGVTVGAGDRHRRRAHGGGDVPPEYAADRCQADLAGEVALTIVFLNQGSLTTKP